MINGKRIAVVMPAYNAEKTLEATVAELPELVDIRILVDDHSSDRTAEVANRRNSAARFGERDRLRRAARQFLRPASRAAHQCRGCRLLQVHAGCAGLKLLSQPARAEP